LGKKNSDPKSFNSNCRVAENYFVMQVRLNSDSKIENKIIGVHELKESNSAKTMYDAL